ncbi:uncharacterized protein LOC117589007 isoform X2 [Drosophila guanche]|uniref:uncharacterized protein LOC117589007 isoform X2 n=1 Tax=Drosophila guanche TaxID=7266 RepID=UPI0014724CE4|nr:uncharacterized protein LOC117589007 isoform X2 [Drosophila guanche]
MEWICTTRCISQPQELRSIIISSVPLIFAIGTRCLARRRPSLENNCKVIHIFVLEGGVVFYCENIRFRSSACMAIKTCDPFQPMCATSKNDHQFFYSQCEMVRDTCLTGKGKY